MRNHALAIIVSVCVAHCAHAEKGSWAANNCFYTNGGRTVVGCRVYIGWQGKGTISFSDNVTGNFYYTTVFGDPRLSAPARWSPKDWRKKGTLREVAASSAAPAAPPPQQLCAELAAQKAYWCGQAQAQAKGGQSNVVAVGACSRLSVQYAQCR
jgi:hypothetical protein